MIAAKSNNSSLLTATQLEQGSKMVMLLNEGERRDEADGDGDLEEEREMVR